MSLTFADIFLEAASRQPPTRPITPTQEPSSPSIGPIAHPPIRRQKSAQLTRDQRHDCQLLASLGWSYPQIKKRYPEFSIRQIGWAYNRPCTPKKRSGRPPVLTLEQCAHLAAFVCTSAANRRMSYAKLAEVLN